jgi:hypothetical protein
MPCLAEAAAEYDRLIDLNPPLGYSRGATG